MLPLPGSVRRAIFAEYEPQVEYLDAIAWRRSPHALYLVATSHARKAKRFYAPTLSRQRRFLLAASHWASSRTLSRVPP
jgi:monoamine oxidase